MLQGLLLLVVFLAIPANSKTVSQQIFETQFNAKKFVGRTAGHQRFAVTTIRQKEMKQKDATIHLAVSSVNPQRVHGTYLSDFFGAEPHRPMTWTEAKRSCESLQIERKKWRLPTVTEVESLRKIGFDDQVVQKDDTLGLGNNFVDLILKGKQFSYVWTSESHERDKKIYEAVDLLSGNRSSETAQKPISVICVADYEVQNYRVDLARLEEKNRANN